MPCCSAVNCSNRTENSRLFAFPVNPHRRAKWLQNMRRDNWTPTSGSRLCESHFEESQFEKNRQDGWRKLKPNAVPTLFNVPNPPHMINPPPRKSVYKNHNTNKICSNSTVVGSAIVELQNLVDNVDKTYAHEPATPLFQKDSVPDVSDNSVPLLETKTSERINQLEHEVQKWKVHSQKLTELLEQVQKEKSQQIQQLEKENQQLRKQLSKVKNANRSFLNEAQMKKIEQGSIKEWSSEAVIKGLKLRFALSVAGYNYLLKTGYPSPSYSTLMRRIQDFKLEFGVFQDILKILQFKVETMDHSDKFCAISYDEMQINPKVDYDKSTGKTIGYVTLDPVVHDKNWVPCNEDLGEKIIGSKLSRAMSLAMDLENTLIIKQKTQCVRC